MGLMSILAFVLALAGAATAAPIASPGISPDDVAAVLRTKSQTAEITRDKDGDPLIKVTSGASKYSVYFYNRNRQMRYDSIQFATSFDTITAARIAEWNKSKRFGRVYLERDGKVWIEMDIETTRGFTTEALEENIDRWLAVLEEFTKYAADK